MIGFALACTASLLAGVAIGWHARLKSDAAIWRAAWWASYHHYHRGESTTRRGRAYRDLREAWEEG